MHCAAAAALAADGDLAAARKRARRAMTEDWPTIAMLWKQGADCTRWLSAPAQAWFQIELRELKPRLRRDLLFGMPLVRRHADSVRAGVFFADSERFVPAHPHVTRSLSAYLMQNSRRAVVLTGSVRSAASAEQPADIEDFAFRIYELERAEVIAAQVDVPWQGRLRVALEPERALFVAGVEDYPWFEIERGWVSADAYAQFKERYVVEPSGYVRLADPDKRGGGDATAPVGAFVEFTAAGTMLRRESTSLFVIEGPALDVAGTVIPLGAPVAGEFEWVAAFSPDRSRVAISLLFERCAGRGAWHRVVELAAEGEERESRVLGEGPGLGLALYDLDGHLFVQSGERLSVAGRPGQARALGGGLLLLAPLGTAACDA